MSFLYGCKVFVTAHIINKKRLNNVFTLSVVSMTCPCLTNNEWRQKCRNSRGKMQESANNGLCRKVHKYFLSLGSISCFIYQTVTFVKEMCLSQAAGSVWGLCVFERRKNSHMCTQPTSRTKKKKKEDLFPPQLWVQQVCCHRSHNTAVLSEKMS